MEPFSKAVNDFKLLNILTKKIHCRCLFASSTSLQFELILTEWEFVILTGGIEASKMSIVYERRPSTKASYKNEKPIKEVIISPLFIFY